MLYAVTFVAFVFLGAGLILTLGPLAGTLVWLIVYGATMIVGRWLLRIYDPMRAYTIERASLTNSTDARVSTPDTSRRPRHSHTEAPF